MKQRFQWTNDQNKALQIIQDWWESTFRHQTLCISGFAGTGKTTLISKLPKILKEGGDFINVAYATLTAKASLVLRNKGVPASTIHSLIYDTQIVQDQKTHKIKYIFHLKRFLTHDLIIIDQASMVSDVLYNDLKSFGIPILFIGDSFQLPPINSEFNLMSNRFVEYTMKDIVRQQQDNTIIKMSVKLRNFQNIPYIDDPQFKKIHHSRFKKQDLINYQQIITGKNITRIQLNKYCRFLKNYNPQKPVINDRMTFLRNNYQDNVFNGQQIILTKTPKELGKGKYQIEGQDVVTNNYVDVNVVDDFINNLPSNIENKRIAQIERSDFNQIDYAYAISCHKCVSGDTKIFTDHGIIQIKDYNGQKIFDGLNYVYPKQFIRNGVAKVKTITTHNGYTNTVTLNHNNIVINEYGQLVKKKTNELNIGDKVLIAKNITSIKEKNNALDYYGYYAGSVITNSELDNNNISQIFKHINKYGCSIHRNFIRQLFGFKFYFKSNNTELLSNVQIILLNNNILSKKNKDNITILDNYKQKFKNWLNGYQLEQNIQHEKFLDNFEIDKIQNISDEFETETYCFQIQNSHMFVQNGILSGNSQGSQFQNVLLWDDLFAINNQEMRNRWLYTGITRASKTLTWVT